MLVTYSYLIILAWDKSDVLFPTSSPVSFTLAAVHCRINWKSLKERNLWRLHHSMMQERFCRFGYVIFSVLCVNFKNKTLHRKMLCFFLRVFSFNPIYRLLNQFYIECPILTLKTCIQAQCMCIGSCASTTQANERFACRSWTWKLIRVSKVAKWF